MDILFATTNKGKIREIKEILKDTDFVVKTTDDLGINVEVVEDGKTFSDNAEKKAVALMKASGLLTLADDSGIEIDFLDKKPGVHSARYLGEDTPYKEKNTKILEMMKDVPKEKRTARFISVIAAAFPDGRILKTEGVVEGYIDTEIKGVNGFGYDPIFFVPELNKTTGEMSPEEKNNISHRGKALRLMKDKLKGLIY